MSFVFLVLVTPRAENVQYLCLFQRFQNVYLMRDEMLSTASESILHSSFFYKSTVYDTPCEYNLYQNTSK